MCHYLFCQAQSKLVLLWKVFSQFVPSSLMTAQSKVSKLCTQVGQTFLQVHMLQCTFSCLKWIQSKLCRLNLNAQSSTWTRESLAFLMQGDRSIRATSRICPTLIRPLCSGELFSHRFPRWVLRYANKNIHVLKDSERRNSFGLLAPLQQLVLKETILRWRACKTAWKSMVNHSVLLDWYWKRKQRVVALLSRSLQNVGFCLPEGSSLGNLVA